MGSMTELAAWAAVNRDMLAVVRAGWMRVVAWLAEWQVAAIPDKRVGTLAPTGTSVGRTCGW